MLKILTSLFCLLTFTAFAETYQVSLLGIESIEEIGSVVAINDKSQVIGYYNQNGYDNKNKIYIYDNKTGLTLIDSNEESIYPTAINNAGQILGFGSKPFIWSRTLGIRYLEIPNSHYISAVDFNDFGQIIGSYTSVDSSENHSFLWDYGIVTDMGPGSELSHQIEALGYKVMDIHLTSINNKGELAGSFAYGKYNQKRNKYVIAGYKVFLWDGDIHILDLPETLDRYPCQVKVNNREAVMIVYSSFHGEVDKTYVWDIHKGISSINNFYGLAINDATVLAGMRYAHYGILYRNETKNIPAIWKDGHFISLSELLNVKDISDMAPPYSDDYAIESLSEIIGINNKNQIPSNATIWGDSYPCLIEPVKD